MSPAAADGGAAVTSTTLAWLAMVSFCYLLGHNGVVGTPLRVAHHDYQNWAGAGQFEADEAFLAENDATSSGGDRATPAGRSASVPFEGFLDSVAAIEIQDGLGHVIERQDFEDVVEEDDAGIVDYDNRRLYPMIDSGAAADASGSFPPGFGSRDFSSASINTGNKQHQRQERDSSSGWVAHHPFHQNHAKTTPALFMTLLLTSTVVMPFVFVVYRAVTGAPLPAGTTAGSPYHYSDYSSSNRSPRGSASIRRGRAYGHNTREHYVSDDDEIDEHRHSNSKRRSGTDRHDDGSSVNASHSTTTTTAGSSCQGCSKSPEVAASKTRRRSSSSRNYKKYNNGGAAATKTSKNVVSTSIKGPRAPTRVGGSFPLLAGRSPNRSSADMVTSPSTTTSRTPTGSIDTSH